MYRSRAGRFVDADGLTYQQSIFVARYLTHGAPSRAYIEAGYGGEPAYLAKNAWLLKEEPHIAKVIEREQAIARDRLCITKERVLMRLAQRAFYDPRKFFDEDGQPTAIQDIDDDTAPAICGLEVKELYAKGPNGEHEVIGKVTKWKLADSDKALELLCKFLGITVGEGKENKDRLQEMVDALNTIPNKSHPAQLPEPTNPDILPPESGK